MRLIIFGPPGVGKGTISEWIIKKYSIPHVSSGNIIREVVATKGKYADKVRPYLEKGLLVPDDIIIGMIEQRLNQKDCDAGYILDGFPRTVEQAKFLDKRLSKTNRQINHAINLKASDKIVIERLSGRRICSKCDAIYHLKNIPPKIPGKCDKCGSALFQREDDKPETIKRRIKVYNEQTMPLIQYYKKQKLLKDIDTNKPLEEIFSDVDALLSS